MEEEDLPMVKVTLGINDTKVEFNHFEIFHTRNLRRATNAIIKERSRLKAVEIQKERTDGRRRQEQGQGVPGDVHEDDGRREQDNDNASSGDEGIKYVSGSTESSPEAGNQESKNEDDL